MNRILLYIIFTSLNILASKVNAQAYESIDSLKILQEKFNELDDNSNQNEISSALYDLGKYYYRNGLFENALNTYHSLFANFKLLNISKATSKKFLFEIAKSYIQLEEFGLALDILKEQFETINIQDKLQRLGYIAKCYESQGDFQSAILYHKKLLETPNLSNEIATNLENNIAYYYHKENNYEQSIIYYNKALDKIDLVDNDHKITIYNNLAINHFNQGNSKRSLEYLDLAYQLAKDDLQRARIENTRAQMFLIQNDYINAVQSFQNAYKNAKQADNDVLIKDSAAGLSLVYSRIHEYDQAIEYYKEYSQLSEQIAYDIELKRKLNLEKQRQLEQADKRYQLLKSEKELQELRILTLETETQNKILETEALRADSINTANQLRIALSENQIAKINSEKQELELIKKENQFQITKQELEILQANEENFKIEKEKQEQALKLSEQMLSLQKKDAQIQQEQLLSKLKQEEADKARSNFYSSLRLSLLLFGLSLFAFWAYRNKRKDNLKISKAYESLSAAQNQLKTAEQRIRELLNQQVSGAIAETLITGQNQSMDEERFVTVMFLDIRDFTKYCEGKTPSQIIAFQNAVFSFMIDIIERHNGIVNQLVGDGFMATFGAPKSFGNDAQYAIDACKEIFKQLNQNIIEKKIPPTRVGIGLHSGKVVTGNVGNEKRKQYSITGNAVIISARLEQLNKSYNSDLVISKSFYNLIDPQSLPIPSFNSIKVKGRSIEIETAAFKGENLF